ncbi:MAG: glycosyltransferase involved in cell wall biosynthesis [Gammaproteobacteria bacterium]|jgi:glycosyltransferase involved in cell wall biosynthesis
MLLQTVDLVRNSIDCRLLVLGDGKDRQALEALTKTLGITLLIDMPGFVSDVEEYLASSGLFVLSSDYEGLLAVVLEALAHNISVVSTDPFLAARELLKGVTS